MLALTSLCKNRAWILPHWLACVDALEWPKADMAVMLLDDGSTDNSRELLDAWGEKRVGQYALLKIMSTGAADTWGDQDSSRVQYDRMSLYAHLSELRNLLIEEAVGAQAALHLSIDSDILFPPDIARALAAHDLPYVSSIVINDNSAGMRGGDCGDYTDLRGRWCNIGKYHNGPTTFAPIKEYPLCSLIQVAMSGACYLADKRAFGSGARFGPHAYGEDAWYCMQLRDHGVPVYCDTTPRCVHVMEPGHLEAALRAWGRE